MVRIASRQRPGPAKPLSYEAFLEWLDEDVRAEWVGGRIELASPASLPHQRAVAFLFNLVRRYASIRSLGEAVVAPFQVKLGQRLSGREPDVLFVATEHLGRMRSTWLEGPPDLAVEVVSPDSISRDWEIKYAEYEASGVREYWVIDPDRRRAAFFVRTAEGTFRTVLSGADGRFASTVLPGLWVDVEWLWCDPLPDEVALVQVMLG